MKDKLKNRLSTALLAVLIIAAFVLSIGVWIFEYMVPQRVFSPEDAWALFTNSFFERYPVISQSRRVQTTDMDGLFTPSSVIMTSGGKRRAVVNDANQLAQAHGAVRRDIARLLSSGQTAAREGYVSRDEWARALCGDGIFIDFAHDISLLLYAEHCSTQWPAGDVAFRYMLLTPGGDGNSAAVYLRADDGSTVCLINSGGTVQLDDTLLDELGKDGAPNQYLFAAEAVNTPMGRARIERCAFEPQQLVSVGGVVMPDIVSSSPLSGLGEEGPAENVVQMILHTFGHNSVTSGHYTDSDGSDVYVENFSMVRISPEGMIEYSVFQNEKGIEVTPVSQRQDGKLTGYDMLAASWRLLSQLGRGLLGGDGAYLSFCGMEETGGAVRIYFEYRSNGLPVYCGVGEKGYPVSVEIRDGCITGAQVYPRVWRVSGEARETVPIYYAMDMLADGQGAGGLELMYVDGPSGGSVSAIYAAAGKR